MEYLWIAFLILAGLAMVCKPEILWEIEHAFTVKNGEPTELYFAFRRIGGIILIVTGVIALIVSFL